MIPEWVHVAAALAYLGGLFAIATYGDRRAAEQSARRTRPTIYALSIAVYCTSWTYFGSVGYATRAGLEYLAIYVGPAIAFLCFLPLWRRINHIAKIERITSIAHFLSARYGKSSMVAVVVTLIAVIGTIPYIALQLKAVSFAFTIMTPGGTLATPGAFAWPLGDITLWVSLVMGAFAILFGTRHADATEQQEGLMLSIAVESMVKLLALIAVGLFVCFALYDGPGALFSAVQEAREQGEWLTGQMSWSKFIVLSFLSFSMAFLLPRQFHVTVIENNNRRELNRAVWLFPLYLVLINLFVTPIALAGVLAFGPSVDPDMFVLALPRAFDAQLLSLLVFIGGLSAATAMVIVAQVALAIMIGNDIVLPMLFQRRAFEQRQPNMHGLVLTVRRLSIIVVMALAYLFCLAASGNIALASIGLLSFAAFGQLAPVFFIGLYWRGGTARGAIWGMVTGIALWAYTLLLPAMARSGTLLNDLVESGPFDIQVLRPEALLGIDMDPYLHGVLWSIAANVTVFVVVSLSDALSTLERRQANTFVSIGNPIPSNAPMRPWRTDVTLQDIQTTVARYLGEEQTRRSFKRFAQERGVSGQTSSTADIETVQFAEQLLGGVIGAASARLILSLLLNRRDPSSRGAMQLLDDATEALQYNRDLLQTALDQVVQGICVFDRELRLIYWNRQFREYLNLSPTYGQVGTMLSEVVEYLAKNSQFDDRRLDMRLAEVMRRLVDGMKSFTLKLKQTGMVLEVSSGKMPDGGLVIAFSDITERMMAEQALASANETLERRVRERTEELMRLNEALRLANAEAEEANVSKTRFLAAASHDILQPLNAARLYTSSLMDRLDKSSNGELIGNVEASLSSVEDILGMLLDISRLDTGTFKPEMSVFPLQEVLDQLLVDHEMMASEKGIRLTVLPTSINVRSDRRLLRRLLQNLISNAIKYTPKGRVLVGVRRHKEGVTIQVLDTGLGIHPSKQDEIFKEFKRLDEGAAHARGLGLGLSIVERIARVLNHQLLMQSTPGSGSSFSIKVPIGARSPKVEGARPAMAVRSIGHLDGMVVGCIDNEATILEGMAALLSWWGTTVLTGQTANELDRAIRRHGAVPDILLVDYHLDNANGLDAIEQLRRQHGTGLPAVLITADRSIDVRDNAARHDMQIMHKPVKPAALRALLTRIRSQRSAAE